MADTLEILTLHSTGERDGKPFSPSSLPYYVLQSFVDNLKGFVIGGKGTKEERDGILREMEISQRDGSWTLVVLLAASWLSSAPIQSLKSDLSAISERRFDDISDTNRARAFRKLQSEMRGSGLTHLGVKSDALHMAETDILPQPNDPAPAPEVWLDAQQYFTASPKLNIQLELDGGKTVKADSTVDGFDTIGANVPDGNVQVLVAFQFNPETGERRNERILEVIRRSAVFDEKAFDEMASKPNGWSNIANPVEEIRNMRDGHA